MYALNTLITKTVCRLCMYIIMIMKEDLTKEELYMLARIKKVDFQTINHFRNCLDIKKVRKELIEYEFKCLVKEKTFKKNQIIKNLMKKYSVSKSYIEQIIYSTKTNKGRQCVRCGRLISTYKWGRNNGVCDSCINKAIKNYDLYEKEQSDDNNETGIGRRDEIPSGK